MLWVFGLMICQLVSGIQTCPFNIFQSGFSNDIANMIGVVRDSPGKLRSSYDNGVCGEYKQILNIHGIQNSSLRFFENQELNVLVNIFNVNNDSWIKDFQSDDNQIDLVPPTFMNNHTKTEGLVVSTFETIVKDLIRQVPPRLFRDELRHRRVILGSYGIGGALNNFWAAYLDNLHNITVEMVLNFGAPFMSDRVFDEEVIIPLRRKIGYDSFWNIEVVNIINADDRDSISETFNRNRSPFVFVNWASLCVAYILPYYDLNIHDVSNYKVPLIGFNCN